MLLDSEEASGPVIVWGNMAQSAGAPAAGTCAPHRARVKRARVKRRRQLGQASGVDLPPALGVDLGLEAAAGP
jgi:hypothetical protein